MRVEYANHITNQNSFWKDKGPGREYTDRVLQAVTTDILQPPLQRGTREQIDLVFSVYGWNPDYEANNAQRLSAEIRRRADQYVADNFPNTSPAVKLHILAAMHIGASIVMEQHAAILNEEAR